MRLTELVSRRVFLPLLVSPLALPLRSGAVNPPADFLTSTSGVQFADAKTGTGVAFQTGQRVAIDYVMSTTGARYGAKIDSTQDRQAPFSWTLGDGTVITGLELAILGEEGMPPMLPGGVRRLIVPSALAYAELAKPNKNSLQVARLPASRAADRPRASGAE